MYIMVIMIVNCVRVRKIKFCTQPMALAWPCLGAIDSALWRRQKGRLFCNGFLDNGAFYHRPFSGGRYNSAVNPQP